MEEDGDGEEEEEDEYSEEEEEQPQHQKLHQPTRKLTQIIRGQAKKYYYLKTVKSMEEFEKFRFKVMQITNSVFFKVHFLIIT
jgi:hypothetical protein